MNKDKAQQSIEEIAQGYNTIAKHFSQTRHSQWSAVTEMVQRYILPHQRVLDSGCGNGRIADLFSQSKVEYVGMDISSEMVDLASRLHPRREFVVGSMISPPFADASFDAILSIASFHHVPSKELRIKTVQEAYRLLRPGGYVLMTNWNLHQWKYTFDRIQRNIQFFFGGHEYDYNDVVIPWKNAQGITQSQRYYHAFTKKELSALAAATHFRVCDQWYDTNGMRVPRREGHNIMTVLQKAN